MFRRSLWLRCTYVMEREEYGTPWYIRFGAELCSFNLFRTFEQQRTLEHLKRRVMTGHPAYTFGWRGLTNVGSRINTSSWCHFVAWLCLLTEHNPEDICERVVRGSFTCYTFWCEISFPFSHVIRPSHRSTTGAPKRSTCLVDPYYSRKLHAATGLVCGGAVGLPVFAVLPQRWERRFQGRFCRSQEQPTSRPDRLFSCHHPSQLLKQSAAQAIGTSHEASWSSSCSAAPEALPCT